MPKNPKNKPGEGEDNSKPKARGNGRTKPSLKGKHKGGKGLPRDKQSKPGPQPKKGENIAKKVKEQAKKNGRKKANVLLPVLYIHPEKEAEPEEKTRAQISYEDKLMAVQCGRMARKGFNDTEIIKQLGIAASTFYDWVNDKPYFAYQLLQNRGVTVAEVENRLIDNALGFFYEEEQMAGNGTVQRLQKYKLPETKAIEFFLTNRAAEQWKKKVEKVHSAGAGMEAVTFTLKRRQ